MSMDPSEFERVIIGDHERSPASPTPPDDPLWRGILLAAPRTVRIRAGHRAVVPLCVYSMLDASTPDESSTPSRTAMRVVATSATMQPAEGILSDLDPGDLVGGYRNHDMMAQLRLPHVTGEYEVYVEFRGVRSNAVTVALDAQS